MIIVGFDYVASTAQARNADRLREAEQWRRAASTGRDERRADRRTNRRRRLRAALRALAAASAASYPLPFVPELHDYPVRRP